MADYNVNVKIKKFIIADSRWPIMTRDSSKNNDKITPRLFN